MAENSDQNMTQNAAPAQQPAPQPAPQQPASATATTPAAAPALVKAPAAPQPPTAQDERIWAALSYIPMVALVAFLIKPNSDFVKLHGKQGLLLFIIFFISLFVYFLFPPLGAFLAMLAQFACFVIGIYSIYQAMMGVWWKTPVLGQLADVIPVAMLTNVATKALTGDVLPTTSDDSAKTPPPAAPPSTPAA